MMISTSSIGSFEREIGLEGNLHQMFLEVDTRKR